MNKILDLLKAAKPPRANPVLSVGVTGHRSDHPNWLTTVDQISEQVLQILNAIKMHTEVIVKNGNKDRTQFYTKGEAVEFRVYSLLTEGGASLITNHALDLDFKLNAILPFPKVEYLNDFVSASALLEFEGLYRVAQNKIELNGQREGSVIHDAYVQAEQAVINHSDLLIAVWDGKTNYGFGDPSEMIAMARKRGIPVIWINAEYPDDIKILVHSHIRETIERLPHYLVQILLAASSEDERWIAEESPRYQEHFQENHKRLCSDFTKNIFETIVSFEWRISSLFHFKDFRQYITDKWHGDLIALELNEKGAFSQNLKLVIDRYFDAYTWSVHLARHYTGLSESSLINIFSCSILAIFFGFLEMSGSFLPKSIALVLQAFFIVAIFLLIWFKQEKGWLKRGKDYRLLHAQLKGHLLLAPLYQSFKARDLYFLHNAGLAYGRNWTNHYFRTIVNMHGILPMKHDDHYLSDYRQFLLHLIDNEINYQIGEDLHSGKKARMAHIRQNLMWFSLGFFLLGGGLNVLHYFNQLPHFLDSLTIVFPLIGMTNLAIYLQNSFEVEANESDIFGRQLLELRDQIAVAREHSLPDLVVNLAELLLEKHEIIQLD